MHVVADSATQAPFSRSAASSDEALDELLAVVKAGRDAFDAHQQLSDEVVTLMRRAGVYRAMVARRFGGEEMAPADFLRLIETISMANGSAGWVASFGFTSLYLSALPMATLDKIYADGPDVVFAGGIFPPQKAKRVDGGVEVSGCWSWGSGCCGADLIGVGIRLDGGGSSSGLPYMAVMPRENVRIVKNWEVNGLKGTGSHDLAVDKVFVPDDWIFVRGGEPSLGTPLYRYPAVAIAAQVLAVVGLGIARAALDEITEIAGSRNSITGAPVLAERAYVQIDIAEAEASLRAARAFFYDVTNQAYSTLETGEPLSLQSRNLLRLASSHAAKCGLQVAQTAYRLSGTTGIFTTNSIAKRLQDALIVPQHAFLSEGTWQSAGRVMLGLDNSPGFP